MLDQTTSHFLKEIFHYLQERFTLLKEILQKVMLRYYTCLRTHYYYLLFQKNTASIEGVSLQERLVQRTTAFVEAFYYKECTFYPGMPHHFIQYV